MKRTHLKPFQWLGHPDYPIQQYVTRRKSGKECYRTGAEIVEQVAKMTQTFIKVGVAFSTL